MLRDPSRCGEPRLQQEKQRPREEHYAVNVDDRMRFERSSRYRYKKCWRKAEKGDGHAGNRHVNVKKLRFLPRRYTRRLVDYRSHNYPLLLGISGVPTPFGHWRISSVVENDYRDTVSAQGHFRSIRPVLAAGPCLLRPESGPEGHHR